MGSVIHHVRRQKKRIGIFGTLVTVLSLVLAIVNALHKTGIVPDSQPTPTPTTLAAVPNSTLPDGVYPVAAVVDGDTLKVTNSGTIQTIRLIGIDTPETVKPSTPIQCYAPEASAEAKTLLTGQTKDKYQRFLRYLYLSDGSSYNLFMIRNGFAHEDTYDKAYAYQAQYRQAEQQAKAAEVGFWSPQTCNGDTTKAEPKK